MVAEAKSGARVEKELVLIGGGHAHVQVLRRWMMDPLPGVRLTLVSDGLESVYSGMVPGAVAGDYEPGEVTIDLLPLARRAGARCIRAAVTAIDSASQVLELEASQIFLKICLVILVGEGKDRLKEALTLGLISI